MVVSGTHKTVSKAFLANLPGSIGLASPTQGLFTPRQKKVPPLYSGMKTIPFSAHTGFKAPFEPLGSKVEDFQTGFT